MEAVPTIGLGNRSLLEGKDASEWRIWNVRLLAETLYCA